jgi:hypothetical protein
MTPLRVLGDVTKVDVTPTWDGFPEPVRNAINHVGGNLAALVILAAGVALAAGVLMTLVGSASHNVLVAQRGKATTFMAVISGALLYAAAAIANSLTGLFGH